MDFNVPVQDDRRQVAIAILHRDGLFLMQLRDNDPKIVYPGYWGLFGGHLEAGETPDIAVHRELLEEIGYAPAHLEKFGCYADTGVVRHVYCGALAVGLAELELNEGWDMALLSAEDIRRGEHYSAKAEQTRPLGETHQRILLDFLAQSEQKSL